VRYSCLLIIALAFAISSLPTPGQQKSAGNSVTKSARDTVEGLVRDIACPIQNTMATATTFNLQCAVECARQGSPLIILTRSGIIYVPISTEMPDRDQRQRLMPFLGKFVKVTGKVYQRAGTHAIAIETIDEMKEVHLNSNAQ
jgi:hypothetical protein